MTVASRLKSCAGLSSTALRDQGVPEGRPVLIDYALDWRLELTWARVKELAGKLRVRLQSLGFVTLRDLGVERCGIVTFTVEGKGAEQVRRELAAAGINVNVSLRENARLNMEDRGLDSLVRASVHYYNSEDEIERFCQALCSRFHLKASNV